MFTSSVVVVVPQTEYDQILMTAQATGHEPPCAYTKTLCPLFK